MNRNAEALLEQVGEYVHRFDRVSVGGRFDGLSSSGAVRLLTDEELVEALAVSGRLVRLALAEQTRLAGEVARRSESRDDSLAQKMGAGSAANLVAQVTGVPRAQAGTMVSSGEAHLGWRRSRWTSSKRRSSTSLGRGGLRTTCWAG